MNKNSKLETLNSKQTRNYKSQTKNVSSFLLFVVCDLFRISSLEFRV